MRKALILIDYINEIVHPAGKTPACAAMFAENNIIDKTNKVTAYARKNDWLVVWVKVCFEPGHPEVHPNSRLFTGAKKFGAYIKNTWATELIEGIDTSEQDYTVYKHRVSAFFNNNLDMLLRANNVEEVYIAGVSTEMAIQTTVRDAHDRDYIVKIIGDMCASGSKEFHDCSLAMLDRIADVVDAKSVVTG